MRQLMIALMCVVAAAAPATQTQTGASTPEPQAPGPEPQTPTFRTGVDLISIDVGVVDDRGRPVEDLRPPDFAVKIDGEVRQVVSAELVKVDIEAAKKQVADKSETFYTTNLTPPNGRQIVIAIDQINIRPGALRAVLSTAARFVDRLSPLDQVAFVTFPEPGPRVGFTSDRIRLKLAMESLIGHQSRMPQGQFNIGVTEAIAISDKRDQIVLAAVMDRECRVNTAAGREQCQREIIHESSQVAQRFRQDGDESLRGLQRLMQELATVEGPKSMILISEGLAIEDVSELDTVVRLAGAARVSLNVLLTDAPRGEVGISQQPPTEIEDRRLQVQALQNLATMVRGALFHVVGTGEGVFERLASEISAYYLLGVEQRPRDSQGSRHRIDVEVRRRNVTVRSRQAFVLSAATRPKRSPQENLRDALMSPFGVAELPLRVTTFAQQAPGSEKVRMVVAADVGQPGAKPAPFSVAYIVIDGDNRVVANFGETMTLSPASARPTETLAFVSGVELDPGVYSLRFAVVDAEGRRGSVVREVNAWKMAGEELAMGDLVVGNVPAAGEGMRPAVEPHVSTDSLAAYIELYSTSAATFDEAAVTFEIADDPDAPALTTFPARMQAGRQPTWRLAQGLVAANVLPPGRYVARAKIIRDGKQVGVLSRPFVLEKPAAAATISTTVMAAAAISFSDVLPPFERDSVLKPEFIGPMLDAAETRSPALRAAFVEARAGRFGAAALEALSAGDQTAAAFLRGVDLYSKGQLDAAATQLQLAAGPTRREFFPAAFFLGACFAAAGRDREAAGVWQFALGTEPRPLSVYLMAADARMRDGQPGSAIDILKPAYERTPTDDEVGRRLGAAYVITRRFADAIPVLDQYLSQNPSDADMLFAAVAAHYEVVRAGETLSNADVAKLRKYAAAYRGAQAALVSKYLEVIAER